MELVNTCCQASARSSAHASSALTCRNDRRSPRRQPTLPGCCYNFPYIFKGPPSGRASRAEARPRPGPRARAGTRSHRGGVRKTGGRTSAEIRAGSVGLLSDCGAAASPALPAGAPTGGALPPRRPAPHPRAGGPRRYAATMTAPSEHRAGAVLHAPGSLSPRKLTLKGATCGRVLRTALRAALDRELPRQDLGTYQGGRVVRTKSQSARLPLIGCSPRPQFWSGRHRAVSAGPERKRLSVAGNAACAGVRVVVNDVLHEQAVVMEETEADLGSRSQG